MAKPTDIGKENSAGPVPGPFELTDAELDAVAAGITLGQFLGGFAQGEGDQAVGERLRTDTLGEIFGDGAREFGGQAVAGFVSGRGFVG